MALRFGIDMRLGGPLNARILFIGAFAFFSAFTFAASCCAARKPGRFKVFSSGTIGNKKKERRLYYVTGGGEAIRYPVGVGKAGMAWAGTTPIDGKYTKPVGQAPAS